MTQKNADASRPLPAAKRRSGAAARSERLVAAFAVAAISDALSFGLVLAPPVQWGIDLVTALVLFALLRRGWALLPGLVAEAIPGLYVFPFWLLVVGAIAVRGALRRPPEPLVDRAQRDAAGDDV